MNSLSALHEVWTAIVASPGCCRLLAVSVEVAVLAVAVWCLIRVLRIRSARVCSLLWILVLAKGLFGLAFGAPLEVGALRLTESARSSQSATTAMSAEDLARQEAEMQRALREAESSAGAAVASATNGTDDGTQPSSPAIGAQAPRRSTPSVLSGFFASIGRFSFAAHAAGLLTAVWLAGVLWALLATVLDLRRIRDLARASGAPSEELLAVFRAEAARLGIARVPALSVCTEVESPALAGFLRPTVLAPAWLAETADADQLRWMLAHELMHYKQKDTVGLLVRRAAQVALWFHPAVWWAGRQWEEAMERACDRALIAGEADARHYAEQLHAVLKSLMARRSRVRVVTGLFATRTQIGKRIAALLTDSLAMPARLSPSSATLVALFAAAALSFGVGIHRPAAAQAPGTVATPKPTPTVQERLTRVQADLRNITTAMECYRVDYATYPSALVPMLTSPVAYIAYIPEDPFSQQVPPDIYHLNVHTPDAHPVLYSLGPDGVDQQGLVVYDPAQGDKGAGDVVKPLYGTYAAASGATVGIEPPRAAQPPAAPVVQNPLPKVQADLVSLARAMEAYRVDHRNYPPAFAPFLTTPVSYISYVPDDPYSRETPRGAYRLNVATPDHQPILYSIGPDGVDQKGLVTADPALGEKATGDFVNRLDNVYVEGPLGPPTVDERVARARSDLRSMVTAMEAYRIDYDTYPAVLAPSLTSPLAYLGSIPADPFSQANPPEPFRLEVEPTNHLLVLYSVGPDGAGLKALPPYDPKASGGVQMGDLWVNFGPYVGGLDPVLKGKIEHQQAEVDRMKQLVELWYAKTRQGLPETLEEVIKSTDASQTVPDDLFAPGHKISYRLAPEKQTAWIYSLGPDGKDDGGNKRLGGIMKTGEIPSGDIFAEVTLSGLQDRMPSIPEPLDRRLLEHIPSNYEHQRPLVQALLDMEAKENRPNALLYYVAAGFVSPRTPNNEQDNLIKSVLKSGWSDSAASLKPYLEMWQQAFVLIRKGSALDYAKGTGLFEGPSTPVPNFLQAQIAAKALCVEGRYLESQGKPGEALDDYLAVLAMGRDFESPDNTLISAQIGVALSRMAADRVYSLITSGALSPADLERCRARLGAIDRSNPGPAGMVRGLPLGLTWFFDRMRKDGGAEKVIAEQKIEANSEMAAKLRLAAKDLDRVEAQQKKVWESAIHYAETPWWQRNPEEYRREQERLMQGFPGGVATSTPNFADADTRWHAAEACVRIARVATGLEIYKAANAKYPASLDALTPAQLGDEPVLDPFSGKALGFRLDGDRYTLWSVGPDGKDDGGAVVYDPTNGLVSSGDILPIAAPAGLFPGRPTPGSPTK